MQKTFAMNHGASLSAWIRRHRLALIFGAAYAVFSVYAMMHFLSSSQLGDRYYRTKFESMMNGTAWKPFAYRILMPEMTRAIVGATPLSWRDSINQSWWEYTNGPGFKEWRKAVPSVADIYAKKTAYPRLVMTVLLYLMLWGYVLALCKLGAQCFPGNEAVRWFAPVFGLLSISAFSWPWQYIYDIPVLFLSAACYACMLSRNFKFYLFFFVLATLNRETSLFILLFFALWFFPRLPMPSYVGLLTVQGVLYVVIKMLLAYRFSGNPGWFLEENISRVLGADILARAGVSRLWVIAGAFLLLAYRWQEKHPFLKSSLWLAPPLFVAYVFHGNPGEYRIIFDVLPLLVVMGTHTLVEAAGLSRLPVFSKPRREVSP